MFQYRYILGSILGAIVGVLILRELGLIFGSSEMPIRTHAETLIHGTVIFLGFVFAGVGSAAWLNLRVYSAEYRKKIDDLSEINRIKNDLLSAASHEIRSPLTVMGWSIKVMLESKGSDKPFAQWHILEQLSDVVFKLRATANDFLNMARLENNTLEIALAPTSLADVARELSLLIEESKMRTSPLGVEIESDIVLPPQQSINADLRRLHEVVSNLLENAVNYSRSGGHVLVHASVDSRNLMISIRDYGIGIPKEDQPKIFSKLFRAINARRAQSTGTGLGLYLSKKFIEAHNGSLVFDSEEGKGTVFVCTIPLRHGTSVEEFFRRI